MSTICFVPGEECPNCSAHVFSIGVIVKDARIDKSGAVVTDYQCLCGETFFCRWRNLAHLWRRVKVYLGEAV